MTKYTGKICDKHPEAGGLRYTSCRKCVQCIKESRRSRDKEKLKTDPEFREKAQARKRKYFDGLKPRVLAHYGCQCGRCNISDPDVLTIDHINQSGAEHRLQIGEGSRAFYMWLIREGFPPGFRTLCFNCNIKTYLEYKRNQDE